MNDNVNNEGSNILLSFVLGAAAGLAAGMLLSPDTGEGNRRFISQKANDLGKKATDLGKKANDLSGKLGTQVNDTINKITKKKSDSTSTTPATSTSVSTPPTVGTTGIGTDNTAGAAKKPKGPKTI